jgi:hypothetical protein
LREEETAAFALAVRRENLEMEVEVSKEADQ